MTSTQPLPIENPHAQVESALATALLSIAAVTVRSFPYEPTVSRHAGVEQMRITIKPERLLELSLEREGVGGGGLTLFGLICLFGA